MKEHSLGSSSGALSFARRTLLRLLQFYFFYAIIFRSFQRVEQLHILQCGDEKARAMVLTDVLIGNDIERTPCSGECYVEEIEIIYYLLHPFLSTVILVDGVVKAFPFAVIHRDERQAREWFLMRAAP